jgi:hypothetical protein
LLPLPIGALIAARGSGLDLGLPESGTIGMLLVCVPSAVALYALAERPLGFGLGIAAALAAALLTADGHTVVARERSFFGVYTVKRDPAGYHVLVHGTTVHGAQSVDPSGWRRSARASVQRTGRTAARNRRGGPRRRRGRLLPRAGATLDLL